MSNVVKFVTPQPEGPMSPGDWLRMLADQMDAEAKEQNSGMTSPAMVLVVMNESKGGDRYRLRSQRYDCKRYEAVGLLHAAAYDYNAD